MKVKIGGYPDYYYWLDRLFGWNPEQKVSVRIDDHDTWSMDHTLAHIVLPMLVQLKRTHHGAPFTDDEDVPEELRSTSAPPKEKEWDTDDNHFKRWDWILDEMIWAFNQKCRDDWMDDYDYSWASVEAIVHQERMTNGFKLFGKYYESLWD